LRIIPISLINFPADQTAKATPPKTKAADNAGNDSSIEDSMSGRFANAVEKSENHSEANDKKPECETCEPKFTKLAIAIEKDPVKATPKNAALIRKARRSCCSI